MQNINWGIIGCGDVTEVKSGPAFNKVNGSLLVAVMRRDGAKAADYAHRHQVAKWYDDANLLINDPYINAIYIATPPSSHEAYTLAAIAAGKNVYVEKPMTLDHSTALKMTQAANAANIKLSVAHYRRAQPYFNKIIQLLNDRVIGQPLLVRLEYHKEPLTREELDTSKTAWRVDPAISGGGLFHDIAPHQLDMMYHFFGAVEKAQGIATNQLGLYEGDDLVAGTILFKSGVLFNGTWFFNSVGNEEKDWCEITGTKGKISFSFFDGKPITVTVNDSSEQYSFNPLQHVQQPMIERVVAYFTGSGANPCSGEDGAEVMRIIDLFTRR